MVGELAVEFVACNSAETARAIFSSALVENRPFDLVIVGKKLPDADGTALALSLFREERAARGRVIVLAYPSERERINAVVHLSKPVRRAYFFAALRTLLGRSQQS